MMSKPNYFSVKRDLLGVEVLLVEVENLTADKEVSMEKRGTFKVLAENARESLYTILEKYTQ